MAETAAVAPATATNLRLAALHGTVHIFQLFVLPLTLLPLSPWWALLVLPLAALNNPLWSLAHETIHGLFHPSGKINRLAGRSLGIVYGAPWRLVRVGHLLHHQFNRTELNRLEAYRPDHESKLGCALDYYYKLFVGLYVSQILSPLAFYLPKPVLAWAQQRFLKPDTYAWHATTALTRDKALLEMRVDGALIYLSVVVSLWCYGDYWWVVPMIYTLRAFCISFLDYIYHYETPVHDWLHAYNLRLPPALAGFLLNFNLHGVHHRHPQVPWHALPDAFARDNDQYHGDYFATALRQLRGPVPNARLATLGADE